MTSRISRQMNFAIKMEEAATTAAAIYFLSCYSLGQPLWIWVLLFFTPDISMLGYLVNTRFGAYTYNLLHHRAIALVIISIGFFFTKDMLITIGLLLFAHSSFDRMMGYGLKYSDDFKHTSLGWIGKPAVVE